MDNEGVHPRSRATRIQKGKSRHGCQRCKLRHVKCDEARPTCGNCLRINVPCPGYERVLRWSGKYERFQSRPSAGSPGRNTATGCEQGVSPGVHLNTLATDLQRHYQRESSATDIGQDWPGVGLRTGACRSGTATAPATSSGTKHSTTWDDVSSTDPEVSSNSCLEFLDQTLVDVAGLEPTSVSATTLDLLPSQNGIPAFTIIPNPIDVSTTLIEFWFTHVCQMWSTFDSDVNYNRQVAAVNCTTSEVVFHALLSMSAAYLHEITPNLKDSLSLIMSKASNIVEQKILALHIALEADKFHIPIDLVFAVFALGTSCHWTGPMRSCDSLLHSAHVLLRRWQLSCGDLQPEIYAYFRQALVYWEMSLSITKTGYGDEELTRRRDRYRKQLPQITGEVESDGYDEPCGFQPSIVLGSFRGSRPNSWCGISSEVVGIFGQVLTLYRNACERQRDGRLATTAIIRDTACDILIAQELQGELLAMDFNSIIEIDEHQGFSLYTGDNNTPLIHHLYIAEAYRLASLLQLYLAFADLRVQPWKGQQIFFSKVRSVVSGGTAAATLRAEKLLHLSFQLVKTLQQIPPRSGSKRMQPMLYIAAAAGLRYHPHFASMDQSGASLTMSHAATNTNEADQTDEIDNRNAGRLWNTSTSSTPTMTCTSQEILKMRASILRRLSLLQQTLPPRPLGIATDLVKAIWATYDADLSGTSELHWPDIMMNTGLQTLFG